jgi:uncharacterized ion transporter superfamily protein YfcC
MSILATNVGFSAAITNPFTIGVAQRLADLPLYSGTLFRIPVFLAFYALLALFLVAYARRIERRPEASPIAVEEEAARLRALAGPKSPSTAPRLGPSLLWFGAFLVLILMVLVGGPLVPAVRDYALPLVGLLFLIAGVGAGWVAGAGGKRMAQTIGRGMAGIAPAIPLILMAASVQHIVSQGMVIDTILHRASLSLSSGPLLSALGVFALTLAIEFFVASGSAKAFLLMPILVPLADLIGLTRQTAVLAYCFGDGFSNMLYPTNPVLLISLGLTVVTFPKWLRWSLPLWAGIAVVSCACLALAVALGLGPF